MKNLLRATAMLIITSLVIVTMNNCTKTNPGSVDIEKPNDQAALIEKSKAMKEHILAFKTKMEYYRDNPGLKTGEKEQADKTVLDWESDINLTYCYSYLDLSDAVTYDTTLVMPTIVQDSILMTDISAKYFDEIVYAVQNQYFKAPYADDFKKLMVVDLEKTIGGDSLIIKSMIGNTQTFAHPPYDWEYGEKLGTCDGQHEVGIWDAAHEIAKNTRNHFYEAPPTNCRWYFWSIQTIVVDDPLKQENGVYVYRNLNDDPGFDNYKDFLIYNASSDFGTISGDVLCLEHYDELAFYKQNYIDLTQDWINNSNGRKFKACEYTGNHSYNSNNGTDLYQHTLKTFLGYRGIVCEVTIDDISIY